MNDYVGELYALRNPNRHIIHSAAAERGRYEHNMKVLCISGEINTGPRRERPNWNEAVTKAKKIATEQWNREHILIDQRQRMNDTLDTRVKEHLT